MKALSETTKLAQKLINKKSVTPKDDGALKTLKDKLSKIGFINTDSSSSFSSQVKHSLKINDEFIIIINDKNVEENKVTVRHKSTKMSDMNLSINELYDLIGKSYE